ncbi:unnamed protein product [Peniophora sp. CBMAI 1063]|nr:unnamed protein product [Peniophora sp. CBMAI 1063]
MTLSSTTVSDASPAVSDSSVSLVSGQAVGSAQQGASPTRLTPEYECDVVTSSTAHRPRNGSSVWSVQPQRNIISGAPSRSNDMLELADLPEYPVYRRFLASIRKHFLLLLEIESLQALDPSSLHCRPLTTEELDAYLKGLPGCIQISEESFRFDFQLRRTHPFNLNAFDVFATSFLKSAEFGAYDDPTPLPSRFLQKPQIERAIYNHTKSAKSIWYRKFVFPETEDDVHDRLSAAARGTRKRRLYAKRVNAVKRRAPEHIEFMASAGSQAVSSDESSDELVEGALGQLQDKTTRISPVWRSIAFQEWQQSLDALVEHTSRPRSGTRQKPGAGSRHRQTSTRVNLCAVAPRGLPRNCYEATWLAALDPGEKESLRVLDEDYDLRPLECPSRRPLYRRARNVPRSRKRHVLHDEQIRSIT